MDDVAKGAEPDDEDSVQSYVFFADRRWRRRAMAATDTPLPNSMSDAGSGTSVISRPGTSISWSCASSPLRERFMTLTFPMPLHVPRLMALLASITKGLLPTIGISCSNIQIAF